MKGNQNRPRIPLRRKGQPPTGHEEDHNPEAPPIHLVVMQEAFEELRGYSKLQSESK